MQNPLAYKSYASLLLLQHSHTVFSFIIPCFQIKYLHVNWSHLSVIPAYSVVRIIPCSNLFLFHWSYTISSPGTYSKKYGYPKSYSSNVAFLFFRRCPKVPTRIGFRSCMTSIWSTHTLRSRGCPTQRFWSCTLPTVWSIRWTASWRKTEIPCWRNILIYLKLVRLGMGYNSLQSILTLNVLNFWKFASYCRLKPLWSGMGEVVPARTSPTLHPPSPPTVYQLSRLALKELKELLFAYVYFRLHYLKVW